MGTGLLLVELGDSGLSNRFGNRTVCGTVSVVTQGPGARDQFTVEDETCYRLGAFNGRARVYMLRGSRLVTTTG